MEDNKTCKIQNCLQCKGTGTYTKELTFYNDDGTTYKESFDYACHGERV